MFSHPTLEYFGKAGKARVSFVKDQPLDRQAILDAIEDPEGLATKPFKDDQFRLIYRLETAKGPVLIKHFRLPRFKDKLKCWRLAPDEFKRHIDAQNAGIHCAKLLAYYETPFFGMNLSQGLVYECLENVREITDDEVDYAVQALLDLFHAGVHHADFIRTNVLHNDANGTNTIIDFERSSLVAGYQSWLSLCMQTQRFIEFGERGYDHPKSQEFIRKVWDGTHEALGLPLEQFSEIIRILLLRHRSRKEIRKLIFPAEALALLPKKD